MPLERDLFQLQVDRFNPDNTPNLPEAELMAKAGEIAKQAGFLRIKGGKTTKSTA